MIHRQRSLSTILVITFAALFLAGCGATLPVRTGYDRRTGTWKPVPGTKLRKAPPKPSTVKTPSATPQTSPTQPDDATDVSDSTAAVGTRIKGQASFYGKEMAGNATSSGEIFEPDSFTCAHRTLPFGTRLLVTYVKKSSTTTVRVNDRGPHKDGRILDLSRAAADALGLTADGVGMVEAEVVP